ncbi:hypothetical protein PI125_g17079 [Phytophthora idaei]|nr:hypothetical protein PI125_g17079 [Phytophthora idaei]
MRVSMLSRLNLACTDYLCQAEELAHFAQSTEIELLGARRGERRPRRSDRQPQVLQVR